MVGPSELEFGEHLRSLREWLGLSQEQLAENSGLTLAEVRRAELGRHEFDLAVLRALATGLDIEVSEIFRMWEIRVGARRWRR